MPSPDDDGPAPVARGIEECSPREFHTAQACQGIHLESWYELAGAEHYFPRRGHTHNLDPPARRSERRDTLLRRDTRPRERPLPHDHNVPANHREGSAVSDLE